MLIRKAAVIGAGTMGSGIAAHLANAGVPCVLLDIVPPGPGGPPREPAQRSRLAAGAIDRLLAGSPPAFLDPADAALVEPGNLEDHLDRLAGCDWIIEAVTEDLEVKRALYRKIAPVRRADAVFSSNTSGLSLRLLVEGLDAAFRRHFLITHFFNPPRQMYLLEVVPGPETPPEVTAAIEHFAEVRLGKGIVRAKDTPNFIANRIGVFVMAASARFLLEEGLTVEEVDEITASPMGRPKTASFRLQDLVGIDVSLLVMENVRKLLPHDESRDLFTPPDFLKRLVKEGKLGRKTGAGFYRKEKDQILVLDLETFEYRPQRPVNFASLEAAKKARGVGERLKTLIAGSDKAARYAWHLLSETLLYSARRLPEIADDVVSVDRAMRWGFNWDLGPFEAWDAIGVRESAERMRREGKTLPPLVEKLLASGRDSFYARGGEGRGGRSYFDLGSGRHQPIPERPGILILDDLRDRSRPLRANAVASLWDIGDGVLAVEFHSKMNTLSADTLSMIRQGIDETERGRYEALVIGNQGPNFSAGANLAELSAAAVEKRWDAIAATIRGFHQTALAMRYAAKPVVTAVHGLTLGGGCEVALASAAVEAAAETYMGLVELGVGLIPAGGGTRELACRASELAFPAGGDLFPRLRGYFETVASVKTSQSAAEARAFGFLREGDGLVMNRDRALAEAKATALRLAARGWRPPRPRREVRVAGRPGLAEFQVLVRQFQAAGYLTDYDAQVRNQFALVLCGGDVDAEYPASEEYLLDLERETFLSLMGEPKTLERIAHTLKTGKPLRN
jgi:3-hydroxyacyl-CoA dehydrogenase